MALMVSFRLRESYTRWYEGRIVWGLLISATRNLASCARAYIVTKYECVHHHTHDTLTPTHTGTCTRIMGTRGGGDEKNPIVESIETLALAFPVLLKNFCRGESVAMDETDLRRILTEDDRSRLLDPCVPAGFRPSWCLELIGAYIAKADASGMTRNINTIV